MPKSKLLKQMSGTKKNLATDMDAIKDSTKNKLNQLKSRGKSMQGNLEKNAYELGERTRDALTQAEDMASEGSEYIESKVKERPFLTIGLSLLIGLLLGKLGSNNR